MGLCLTLNGMKNLYRVTLQLKGELANVGLKHLKHNDLVYVSGFLKSYHKVSPSGDRNIVYQLYVKELNYVLDQNKKPKDDEDSVHSSPMLCATSKMLKEKSYPDFKHKDTPEKIWLQPDDPPPRRRACRRSAAVCRSSATGDTCADRSERARPQPEDAAARGIGLAPAAVLALCGR
ncbi:protein OSB1, mitochondrial-like isoform X2 [Panicum miliaceum]|uniref:Protein OSB1, mitochondrial-like isoform X2 n=1 Tax=Panicum miliaceum TaxID=4540 RepID=A0A3L6S5V0_PANMI|nr:protein OSB1, mitochondrial-like isoform X2 [Panicum miliaceum]